MKTPKISIIVAVYNTSKYLEKCLEKLTHQTMPMENYEIIIVNDCSTDCSIDIVRKYAMAYSNIRVIDKKMNEATFWSRVDGMALAKGEYIGFVDSDDWPEESMFPKLYELAKEKSVDIVECQFVVEGNGEFEIDSPFEEGEQEISHIVSEFVHRRISAALWMRIYSREITKSVLEWVSSIKKREDFCGIRNEDEFLYPLYLNRAKSYYVLKQRLYHYRVDSGGSIMNEIAKDYDKKLFHADSVIKAGKILLADSSHNKTANQYYEYMQTNNMFYLIGILLKGYNWEAVPRYKNLFKEYWKVCSKKNFRNNYLYLKWILVKILWVIQRNRR